MYIGLLLDACYKYQVCFVEKLGLMCREINCALNFAHKAPSFGQKYYGMLCGERHGKP